MRPGSPGAQILQERCAHFDQHGSSPTNLIIEAIVMMTATVDSIKVADTDCTVQSCLARAVSRC